MRIIKNRYPLLNSHTLNKPTMKTVFFLFALIVTSLVYSQKQYPINLVDGMGDTVHVNYQFIVGEDFKYDSAKIVDIIYQTSEIAQSKCAHPVSYKPYKKTVINVQDLKTKDGIMINFNFLASNSFGAADEKTIYCRYALDYKLVTSFILPDN